MLSKLFLVNFENIVVKTIIRKISFTGCNIIFQQPIRPVRLIPRSLIAKVLCFLRHRVIFFGGEVMSNVQCPGSHVAHLVRFLIQVRHVLP